MLNPLVASDGTVIDSSSDHTATSSPIRHFWHWVERTNSVEAGYRRHQQGRIKRWKEVTTSENGYATEDPHATTNMMNSGVRTGDLSSSKNFTAHNMESISVHHEGDDGHSGIHVASWRWDEIGIYFTFTAFIVVAGLAKVGKRTLKTIPSQSSRRHWRIK